MVEKFANVVIQILLLGLGIFAIWWGIYAIRNKKMMWFTRNYKGGYFEAKSVLLGYFLIAYGVLWIVSCIRTWK